MNKEESDQKYGWRIHDDPVRATEIGVSVCPVCRESSKLVQRQTSGLYFEEACKDNAHS